MIFGNRELIRLFPRESTKFVKKHFKDYPLTICELGTYKAENAISILQELKVKKLYCVDPYEEYEGYTAVMSKGIGKIKSIADKKLKPFNNVEQIYNYSTEAYTYFLAQGITFDFVYIDANHDYSYVKEDLELYYLLLNKVGIIAGHDIQSKGVSRAVLEFANEKGLQVYFGDRRDWWIIKW